MPRLNRALAALPLIAATLLVGCADEDVTVRVTVIDSGSNSGVAGALLGIELGGAYQPTPDPALGNPSWRIGAIADSNGVAELTLPTGMYGFHSFAPDHFYGTNSIEVDSDPFELTIDSKPLTDQLVPIVSDAKLEPSTVGPGGTVQVSVRASGAEPDQPLSEEVLVIIPALSRCFAMNPPSPGTPGVMYPDGLYRKKVTAPTEPGSYDVWVSVTSEGCITAPPIALQLTVQ